MSGNLEKLFRALSAAFPRSDIAIVTAQDETAYSLRALDRLDPAERQAGEPACALWADGEEYHRIYIRLPDGAHLLMLLTAPEGSSPADSLAMVLSLEQALFFSEQQTEPQTDMFSLFIDQLLVRPMLSEQSLGTILAQELHIDLTLPRTVCVIQMPALGRVRKEQDQILSVAVPMIRTMRAVGPDDLVCRVKDDILLCHTVEPDAPVAKVQIYELLAQISQRLTLYLGQPPCIGVGFAACRPEEYALSYTAAQQMLPFSPDQPHQIAFASDHLLELILDNSLPDMLKHFLQESADTLRRSPVLRQTLETLAACDMNRTQAAKRLYIHRNTMALRMENLRSILGFDPTSSDYDRFTLRLLLEYCREQT